MTDVQAFRQQNALQDSLAMMFPVSEEIVREVS